MANAISIDQIKINADGSFKGLDEVRLYNGTDALYCKEGFSQGLLGTSSTGWNIVSVTWNNGVPAVNSASAVNLGDSGGSNWPFNYFPMKEVSTANFCVFGFINFSGASPFFDTVESHFEYETSPYFSPYFCSKPVISVSTALRLVSQTFIGLKIHSTTTSTTRLIFQKVVSSCSNQHYLSFAFLEGLSFQNDIWMNNFYNCYNLSIVKLGKSGQTTFSSSVFKNCYNLTTLDLTDITSYRSIPSLADVTVFSSTPLYNYSTIAGQWGSIYVLSSLYSSWISTTYGKWSVLASRIVSVSQPIDSWSIK